MQINIFRDNTTLNMLNVNVNPKDDQQVFIDWGSTGSLPLKGPLTLFRRERGAVNWQAISTTAVPIVSFTDQALSTDERVYEYRVESINSCGESIGSERHNTIQLRSNTAPADGKILLTWNAYEGWPQGVERYEIWRRLDQQAEPTLVGQVPGRELAFSGASSLDGFEHRFHVKAIARDGTYASWSNELILTYTHELIAPNIITPNGDSRNDTFTIPFLGLYPDNQLIVYNRWGRSVYSAVGYRNDWSAEGLADGTYYYTLLLPQTGKLLKGWIEVLR